MKIPRALRFGWLRPVVRAILRPLRWLGRHLPFRRRGIDEATGVPRAGLRARDLVDESLAGVLARPARAALTTLGTVLGIASLVATLGISRTAGGQIVDRFDELEATTVTVRARSSGGGGTSSGSAAARGTVALPWNVEARLDPLNGVVAAGALADVPNPGGIVTVPLVDPSSVTTRTLPVFAASPGLLAAERGTVMSGRFFDQGHMARADRVVVLGIDAATELGVTRIENLPGIFIGDDQFTVIGIIDSAPNDPGLLGGLLVPGSVAQERWNVTKPDHVVIETELGAASLIASQAALALNPNAPDSLGVSAPADPKEARTAVENDVNQLFLLLGLVSLAVGAIGIANVTLVTVMERTGEIGLRRALGAGRRHIALQFLAESTAMGVIGGIIGASVGIVVVVAVAASRDWTPVLDLWLPFVAPLAGAVVGLVAGLYPSIRAARLEPVEALRAGT